MFGDRCHPHAVFGVCEAAFQSLCYCGCRGGRSSAVVSSREKAASRLRAWPGIAVSNLSDTADTERVQNRLCALSSCMCGCTADDSSEARSYVCHSLSRLEAKITNASPEGHILRCHIWLRPSCMTERGGCVVDFSVLHHTLRIVQVACFQ